MTSITSHPRRTGHTGRLAAKPSRAVRWALGVGLVTLAGCASAYRQGSDAASAGSSDAVTRRFHTVATQRDAAPSRAAAHTAPPVLPARAATVARAEPTSRAPAPAAAPARARAPARAPAAGRAPQASSVPVATSRVSAPSAVVAAKAPRMSAPRVTGSVSDTSTLPQFEAYERWIADELASVTDERRALQALISAHEAYRREPTRESREAVVLRADRLQDVARVARSIGADSAHRDLLAADADIAAASRDLVGRRLDVTRVIVAMASYRREASASAEQDLLQALERYSAGL